MNQNLDEEIVAGWLDPVPLPEMLAALRKIGFSGDVYRGCFADLEASLDDDAAGALHFLRHGYAEGRIFRTALDIGALSRFEQLPVRNRFYLRNILTALVAAWAGTHIRSIADLAAHATAIERLRLIGGIPVLILGDSSANLYRRGISVGDAWIIPLALTWFEGGLDELRRTPPQRLLATQPAIRTIWKFGQIDMQAGWLAHRLRTGTAANDRDAFDRFADAAIAAYAEFLDKTIPAEARGGTHWIAGLFPPVWQAAPEVPARLLVDEFGSELPDRLAGIGMDTLPERTAMHHCFNQKLERAVAPLGCHFVRDFECLLTGNGVVDDRYLMPLRDSADLDYRTTGGILSTSLWSIATTRIAAAPAASITDQFKQLLEEIRIVQMS